MVEAGRVGLGRAGGQNRGEQGGKCDAGHGGSRLLRVEEILAMRAERTPTDDPGCADPLIRGAPAYKIGNPWGWDPPIENCLAEVLAGTPGVHDSLRQLLAGARRRGDAEGRVRGDGAAAAHAGRLCRFPRRRRRAGGLRRRAGPAAWRRARRRGAARTAFAGPPARPRRGVAGAGSSAVVRHAARPPGLRRRAHAARQRCWSITTACATFWRPPCASWP